ncbi:phosphate ABC transporter permease subunit PstC [Herbivorax sp. ANBcel31]|uniref:phosphate ABC transporter permease subunit PstC n=1 Tax=Herbivorax sp. ANBcel31 TaxID=3069754 RepID=UPI0027B7A3D1|nr:phosphate ABC transporter permease subunit PstC [Herbivorax sp. ANBcel31]MDQ2086733.1 phosphate ABC transporter permease subunit PstC [Herbivorax sp. ANBcel31]
MLSKSKAKKMSKDIFEKLVEHIFLLCACISVISVGIIIIYIFSKGSPAIFKIGFIDFLFGTKWAPLQGEFGIFPMIIASLLGTFGAIIVGVTIGLFTAIFMAELAPPWMAKVFRPSVELLAGIPSVVYGFFGLLVIVPMIHKAFGGGGNSLLAVIVILSMMILPTLISISEVSLRSVPREYKEGSLALGASHIQTIFKVLIPASKSGIMAAIVLAIGRAIGETMAVILVAGNSPILPSSLTSPVRTLTANIAIEMGYASGLHEDALFATGVILFVFILILNIVLNTVIKRRVT